MPPSLSDSRSPSRSPRPTRHLPLLGALVAGLFLLGTPAVAASPAKKKSAASAKKKAQQQSAENQALYEEAANLIRGKQFPEAQKVAKRCVEADPKFAECHMLLAASLAGMNNFEPAAEEYRTFLNLAPDHKFAPRVRQTLDNYEKEKAQNPAP